MRKDFEKLFTHLPAPEPPAGLAEAVIGRIRLERRLSAVKARLIALAFGLVGSLAAAVFAARSVWQAMTESGLPQFLSLLFSDADAIVTYWGDFALGVLESLPVGGLILFLAAVACALGALRFAARDAKRLLGSSMIHA
jgi:hypothetical protein